MSTTGCGNVQARRHGSRGVAAVEFAIVLPVFLLILFGIIDFSLMLYDKAIITSAAREGARQGIVLQEPNRVPLTGTGSVKSIAEAYCTGKLINLDGVNTCTASAQLDKKPGNTGGSTVPEFGDTLTVTVQFTYGGPIMKLMTAFFNSGLVNVNMQSVAVMVYE